ncbi:hypothetical protein [Luteimonas huabeiensis]|uniref:hypothetical protein n=1 Tax=Luteimonas huabeiensis TaxID=1244513 RepID=UPI00046684CB|nr:hypothetical protein [Luteimonas huabeiensis]
MKTLLPILLAAALAAAAPVVLADDGDAALMAQRLQALEADPATSGFAALEKLQARQAIEAYLGANARQRDTLRRVAGWRVETAELAARTEARRREIDRLERTRAELLVEAARREADRARAEAERMRVQAQIQAEEAARLREAADAELMARQQAESVLEGVASDQAARLRAARAREAELARKEAELLRQAEQDGD